MLVWLAVPMLNCKLYVYVLTLETCHCHARIKKNETNNAKSQTSAVRLIRSAVLRHINRLARGALFMSPLFAFHALDSSLSWTAVRKWLQRHRHSSFSDEEASEVFLFISAFRFSAVQDLVPFFLL